MRRSWSSTRASRAEGSHHRRVRLHGCSHWDPDAGGERGAREDEEGCYAGVIHGLILYELTYHWHRGRLPGFKSEEELVSSLATLFSSIPLSEVVLRLAARVKFQGDEMLKFAEGERLRSRRLSTCDAVTIAAALQRGYPVLTGDADTAYVAERMGVKIVW